MHVCKHGTNGGWDEVFLIGPPLFDDGWSGCEMIACCGQWTRCVCESLVL